MSTADRRFLDHVNADHYAVLYRCRWSEADANVVVPRLTELLKNVSCEVVDEALRALFRIGTPAEAAASEVMKLTYATNPITKHLAVLALGQIAYKRPELCVEPMISALADESCCRDALRILKYIGASAKHALHAVMRLYESSDFKVRKAAVVTAAAIGDDDPQLQLFLRIALEDPSKVVRDASRKLMRKV